MDALKYNSGPAMPYLSTPCGRATPKTGRVACGHLRPFWTPHAVRLCTTSRRQRTPNVAFYGKTHQHLISFVVVIPSLFVYLRCPLTVGRNVTTTGKQIWEMFQGPAKPLYCKSCGWLSLDRPVGQARNGQLQSFLKKT
jgi:hypothetical protein